MTRRAHWGALVAVVLCALPAAAQASFRTSAPTPSRQVLASRLLHASERAGSMRRGRIVMRSLGRGVRGIVITRNATLRSVHRRYPAAVRRVGRGIWRVDVPLFVARRARLRIAAPAVRELRLASIPGRFASIVARDARLSFRGKRRRPLIVHSWDPAFGVPDLTLADGRATIATRHSGRLDARDAVFASLGFYKGTVSGFALWARGHARATGTIVRSTFTHNYNGAFTYGARDMRWIGNRFTYNAVYGLDPHTGSSGFLVERNYAAHNRRHGIIFSHSCTRNVVIDNVSERNGWHGIVIDDGKHADGPSNYNYIYRNVVRDNGKVGIQLDGSSFNVVNGNRVIGGRLGVRVLGPSHDDDLTGNEITGAATAGAFIYQPASRIRLNRNRIGQTFTGVTIRGADTVRIDGNRIDAVSGHAVKVEDQGPGLEPVAIDDNLVTGAGASPFNIYNASNGEVDVSGNDVTWDYPTAHDLARFLGRGVGPGLWVALLLAVLIGPWVVAAGDRIRRRPRAS